MTVSESIITAARALYVHVPFCRRKCPYCGFFSVPWAAEAAAAVVRATLAELAHYSWAAPPATVYLGGGTPSCLGPTLLGELLAGLTQRIGRPGEFTVEVNPADVTADLLAVLQDNGVNRLSLGAQSFDDEELRLLGRRHGAAAVGRAVAMARAAGFANIGLDLIFALPGGTLAAWRRTLAAALAWHPEHIAAYALSYESGTAFAQRAAAGELVAVDEETDRRMYDLAIDTLAAAGYEHYEISNFALPGRACRHNLNYWANEPYVGIGPAAAGFDGRRRRVNAADIAVYRQALAEGRLAVAAEHSLSAVDIACETAVLNLRRRGGIDFAAYRARTGYDVRQLFPGEIAALVAAGLLAADERGIRLTRHALPVADSVLAEFAAVP